MSSYGFGGYGLGGYGGSYEDDMSTNTFPLSLVVDVAVSISPVAAATPSFNQGLVIGPTTVIPSIGANSRIRLYTGTDGMSQDGFSGTDPEFIAAELYFSQKPAPTFLWVGRQNLTALATVVANATGGSGYVVGDLLTVVQSGASLGLAKVTTVNTGAITGVAIVQGSQGNGYSVANGLATTGGTGTGALINITAVGESALQAVIACRLASTGWYPCMVTDAITADHEAIAPFIESISPPSAYFYTTSDVAVLNNAAGNVGAVLKAAEYSRTLGIYSTAQGGVFPNNAYAVAAVMGQVMGLNTGLANSAFTLKFKVLTGVAPEPLTQSQRTTIESLNINLYLSYNNTYQWLEQGTAADGQFFDEIVGLDMLVADIQVSVVNLLIGTPSVPQTNAGQTQLIGAVDGAADRSVTRGFIAPGTIWQGQTILGLKAGDALTGGYLAQSQSYAVQSSGDRAARKAMPIYLALGESGSVHSLTIGVYVQR